MAGLLEKTGDLVIVVAIIGVAWLLIQIKYFGFKKIKKNRNDMKLRFLEHASTAVILIVGLVVAFSTLGGVTFMVKSMLGGTAFFSAIIAFMAQDVVKDILAALMISIYQPFEIDPATVVLHYAQEIFEGLKAYRTADNKIQLFRPDCNGKRMNDSADRLCIPNIPVEDFVQAVKTLVEVDKDWVPHLDGSSYYIRPFIFANDVGLGVHASKHYVFCIIGAPSGAYYAEGINPVRIYVEDEYIRAAPGLTGFTKCGGNYAASIKAGEMAEEQGFAQVLWLDGVEKKYVEEVGSMNIMFKIDGKIYTAACTGTVLPGVTRRSIIELCKDWGYEVIEGKLAIADVMQAAKEGKLEEVWGTGTAAVVSPVKELKWKDEVAYISDGKIGPLTQKLYDTLTGIQWGKLEDTKGWIVPVCQG